MNNRPLDTIQLVKHTSELKKSTKHRKFEICDSDDCASLEQSVEQSPTTTASTINRATSRTTLNPLKMKSKTLSKPSKSGKSLNVIKYMKTRVGKRIPKSQVKKY